MDAESKSGNLLELAESMAKASGTNPAVWFVADAKPLPYTTGDDPQVVSEIELGKGKATHVGVSCISSAALDRFICSDSFAPCTPVIAFDTAACYLHHVSGIPVDKWSKLVNALKQAPMIVISKKNFARQKENAACIATGLTKLGYANVQLCEVNCNATIGVIAYGATKTVLVFVQEIE